MNVTANNAGYVEFGSSTTHVLTFSRIANVLGTSVAAPSGDTYNFSNGAGLTGYLHGDSVTNTINTLNYTGYTTSVRVNLTTGVDSATSIDGGLANGISNIENVTGGSGNDILIGNAQTTILKDGNGNDIIVGGGGPITITGGTGNDIIITGSSSAAATVHGVATGGMTGGNDLVIGGSWGSNQTNLADLNSLMAEWSRTGVSLTTKIAHLTGSIRGGLNGTNYLNSTTVSIDTGTVALYGVTEQPLVVQAAETTGSSQIPMPW